MIVLKGVETDKVTVQNKTTYYTPQNKMLYITTVHGNITDYGSRFEGVAEDLQGW